MKRRYSIWGREHCSDHDVELAQVDNHPEPIALAYEQMMLKLPTKTGTRKSKIRKFTWVRIVDNGRQ